MIFRLYRAILTTLCVLLCGCDEPIVIEYDPSDSELVSMAYLKEQSTTTPRKITGDVYIEGRVLSSDDSWNIRNTIYITDLTATVEVRVDEKHLYQLFPYGSKVRVSCNSLHMYIYNGITCIGLDREKFWVTSIPKDKIPVYLELIPAPIEITVLSKTINELEGSALGYYVQIREVQFQESDLGYYWVDNDAITKRILVDVAGNRLAVRTLPSASFSLFELPSGSGAIGGILLFDDDEYQLVVTNYQDVKMKQDRF